MYNNIDMDRAWLKERIKGGIDGFIDCEREYLTELLMKYIYEDIFLNGCSINSCDKGASEAVLQIRVLIPDSDACENIIEGIKPGLSSRSINWQRSCCNTNAFVPVYMMAGIFLIQITVFNNEL